jgi:uncharacterized protein (DUF2164 family)
MAVILPDDASARIVSSLKRYFKEQREEDLGDLQAKLLLDFILQEIAPTIYNAAITDAQTYVRDRVADLDGACFEPEFGYWRDSTRRKESR